MWSLVRGTAIVRRLHLINPGICNLLVKVEVIGIKYNKSTSWHMYVCFILRKIISFGSLGNDQAMCSDITGSAGALWKLFGLSKKMLFCLDVCLTDDTDKLDSGTVSYKQWNQNVKHFDLNPYGAGVWWPLMAKVTHFSTRSCLLAKSLQVQGLLKWYIDYWLVQYSSGLPIDLINSKSL